MVQAVLPLGPHRLDNPMVLEVSVINNNPVSLVSCISRVALGVSKFWSKDVLSAARKYAL